MLTELQCIFGADVVLPAKMNWQTYSPKIVKQAQMEGVARITRAISVLLEDENGKCDTGHMHDRGTISVLCKVVQQYYIGGVTKSKFYTTLAVHRCCIYTVMFMFLSLHQLLHC